MKPKKKQVLGDKNYVEYRVKKGDWLSKIARDKTTGMGTYHYLATYNNIKNVDLLEVGQVIKIPKYMLKGGKSGSIEDVVAKMETDSKKTNVPKFWDYVSTPIYTPKIKSNANRVPSKTDTKLTLSNKSSVAKYSEIKLPKGVNNKLIESPNSTYTARLPERSQSIDELNDSGWSSEWKRWTKEFIEDVKRTFTDNDASQIPKIIKRGLLKTLGIEDELSSSTGFGVENQSEQPVRQDSIDYGLPSFYGDTIRHTYLPVSKNQYLLPENINLHDVRLSGRNRGDYTPRNSEAVIIPTYHPIEAYDDFVKTHKNSLHHDSEGHLNKYFGFDSNGRFKVGPIENFLSGDSLALTFYGTIINPIYDNNGKLKLTTGIKDSRRMSPMFRGTNEFGDTVILRYPLMTPLKKDKRRTDKYDNVVGGGMLVVSGNEQRVIRGSIDDVVSQIEELRRRHPGEPVEYYEIDNASYNRGLRTYGGHITEQDWKNYDAQNRHAGHVMMIRPK